MKTIPLTKGYVALVSDRDYKRVMDAGPWFADVRHYAIYAKNNRNGWLHRFVLSMEDPTKNVDHRNHNGLDCQRRNLRVCTQRRNGANARKWKTKTSSKFKGVYWNKRDQSWFAQIKVNYKIIHLGYFSSEVAAAKARDRAARKHCGRFAYLNFPKQ